MLSALDYHKLQYLSFTGAPDQFRGNSRVFVEPSRRGSWDSSIARCEMSGTILLF